MVPLIKFAAISGAAILLIISAGLVTSVSADTDDQTAEETLELVQPHPLFDNLYMLEPGAYHWLLGFGGDGCTVTHWRGFSIDAPYAGHLKATTGVLVERGAQPTRVDWPDDEWSEDSNDDGVVSFWATELTAIITWSALSWPGSGYGDATGDCELIHTIVRTVTVIDEEGE